ncbi:MAG: polyphosphate kinase 1 [Candidatus Kapaibacterium sp.]
MEPDIARTKEPDLYSPEYFFNRELSLIEFNRRVLHEAADKRHPLLERLKFVSIFSSNMDEFFMIRVAGLKELVAAGMNDLSYDGKTPREQLREIRLALEPLYQMQEELLNDEIFPSLKEEGINIYYFEELTDSEKEEVRKYFLERVMPVLTPLSLDPAHPFPRLINRSLNIAFVLQDHTKKTPDTRLAFLQIPNMLPRFIRIEREEGHHFVLIEQIIKAFAGVLFPGLEVEVANTFQVTRDADIEIAEDEAEDLLSEIAEQVKQRRWGTAAVRLEVSTNMPEFLQSLLMNTLGLEPSDVFVLNRPLKLPDFMELTNLDIYHLKDTPLHTRSFKPFQNETLSVFDVLKQHDYMVHHPFDSFSSSTVKFINEASRDPRVLAIKVTLYRTGGDSMIIADLKRAAENGKEVTAFVELKARFDEESNIHWARELEKAGVHVVYGILGLKTHCKIALVVRRESDQLRTYMHLSTGNYNHVSAKLYTDVGFFTSREEFGRDAVHLFNYLTGYSYYSDWRHFIVSPVNLRQSVLEMIEREIDLHTPENPGLIFAKMNSLAHKEVTAALYRASQHGVRIKLLVRGICCLRPGIPGVSDNIEVRSVLGRFLEHSRIFYFKNGGDPETYLSSADWMSRNLHRRVELMFPIYEERLQKRLHRIMDIYWKDNQKSWVLNTDGSYTRLGPKDGEEPFIAQEHFLREAEKSHSKIIRGIT